MNKKSALILATAFIVLIITMRLVFFGGEQSEPGPLEHGEQPSTDSRVHNSISGSVEPALRVEGKLVNENGMPIENGEIMYHVLPFPDEETCLSRNRSEFVLNAETKAVSANSDGEFQLEAGGGNDSINSVRCLLISAIGKGYEETIRSYSMAQLPSKIVIQLSGIETVRSVNGVVVIFIGERDRPFLNVSLKLVPKDFSEGNRQYLFNTDRKGRFAIEGLVGNEFLVETSSPNYVVESPKKIDFSGGDKIDNLEVRIAYVPHIVGQVNDPSGHPLDDVKISLERISDRRFIMGVNIRSDQSGHFVVYRGLFPELRGELPATMKERTSYWLRLLHPAFVFKVIPIDIYNGEVDLGQIYLQEPDITVEGSVVNQQYEPEKAKLSFSYADDTDLSRAVGNCRSAPKKRELTTDESWQFSIPLDGVGKYNVDISTLYDPNPNDEFNTGVMRKVKSEILTVRQSNNDYKIVVP